MIIRRTFAVLADRGHRLRIGQQFHGLGDGFHSLDGNEKGHGAALLRDGYWMVRGLLHQGRKFLLCGFDGVGVSHAGNVSRFHGKREFHPDLLCPGGVGR